MSTTTSTSTATAPADFPAAPLDRPTKFITAAIIAAVTGLMLSIPVAEVGWLGMVVAWALPAVGIALGYAYAPKAYRWRGDGVLEVQRRLFGARTLRIDEAQLTSAVFGLGGIRLIGSGGFFGWYGLFWRKDTGRYRSYVTDRSRLVRCSGPDGIIVVSPEDPQAFVAAVNA